MEVRTNQTYKRDILKKYQEEKGGDVQSYLLEPTRKRIREACIWLYNKRNEKNDGEILRRFFDFKEEEDPYKKIKKFDLDKFRPIDNFLKGKTKDPDDICVEMVSWLIDFKPRPYAAYYSHKGENHIEEEKDTGKISPEVFVTDTSNTSTKENNTPTIKNNKISKEGANNKHKKKYKWSLTLKIVIAFGAILMTTGYFLRDKIQLASLPSEDQRCMVWNENHYEEVTCSWKSLAKLEPYDKKLIDNFQKIEVNVNTQFFFENGLPRIWYYKKPNGKIDYFTANGFHPIYKKDVKPISWHIINKYVFKSPFNTSFLNTPEEEELAVFIFRNDTLDIELAKQLQKNLFKNYRTTPYLIAAKKLNPQLKEHLQQGDLSVYKSDMKKHIDYLCVGSVSYTYRESGMKPKLFTCEMKLVYDIFDTKGNPDLDKSYSKIITGTGFTKEEAKQNTIKKVSL